MKKLSFLCAILFVLSFAACTKDYTCTCIIAGVESINELTNLNKSDAEAACSATEAVVQEGDPNAICTLD